MSVWLLHAIYKQLCLRMINCLFECLSVTCHIYKAVSENDKLSVWVVWLLHAIYKQLYLRMINCLFECLAVTRHIYKAVSENDKLSVWVSVCYTPYINSCIWEAIRKISSIVYFFCKIVEFWQFSSLSLLLVIFYHTFSARTIWLLPLWRIRHVIY